MHEVILDEKSLGSLGDAHDVLAAGLGFPAYYGRNLDALWDCLGDLDEPVLVHVVRAGEDERIEGMDRLLRVLGRAGEHGFVTLVVEDAGVAADAGVDAADDAQDEAAAAFAAAHDEDDASWDPFAGDVSD